MRCLDQILNLQSKHRYLAIDEMRALFSKVIMMFRKATICTIAERKGQIEIWRALLFVESVSKQPREVHPAETYWKPSSKFCIRMMSWAWFASADPALGGNTIHSQVHRAVTITLPNDMEGTPVMLQVVQARNLFFAFCNKIPLSDAIYLNNVTKFEEWWTKRLKSLVEPKASHTHTHQQVDACTCASYRWSWKKSNPFLC